jgi:hypothetical protein
MNEEKSHRMFFTVLFGIMGIALLILAWLIPVTTSDRIIAAAIGSAGILVAVIRIPASKRPASTEAKQPPVNIEAEEKS